MYDTDSTRRHVMKVTGGTMIIGLAGCLDGLGGGDESMDDDDMKDEAMTDDAMEDDEMDDEEMTDDIMDDDDMEDSPAMDPAEAPRTEIDRFSEEAGTLMVRDKMNNLPEPDEPIDFDQKPFITQGLGPEGEVVQYYNFDVQPTDPAPIYAFFRENGDQVEDQLNVIDVIPGDEGYNDFWHVHRVTVPDDYVANTVTSVNALMEHDFEIEPTDTIKNCPVVPAGSSAGKRYTNQYAGLIEGWYDETVINYFLFEEAPLAPTNNGEVPVSPIYVTFNTNPDADGGGPQSGFMTEEMSDQTHNVIASLPGDDSYSPLWSVSVYDNTEFADVSDLASAASATIFAAGTATVNCPVTSVSME